MKPLFFPNLPFKTEFDGFIVIKEGEAEILMHAKNEVFYNKAQVNNRDLSIAVLREFIKRRKQEHEAMLLGKRNRGKKKKKDVKDDVVEDGSGEASNNGVEDGEKMNVDCGNELEKPVEEEGKEVEGNGLGVNGGEVEENKRKEIKPARVLRALSASGLRALRYAREVEDLGEVVALDNDKSLLKEIICLSIYKFRRSVLKKYQV